MYAALKQPIVSNSVLNELATSGLFPDPALFVYSVLGALLLASLLGAYLIFGRSDSVLSERTRRGGRDASWRTQEDSNL